MEIITLTLLSVSLGSMIALFIVDLILDDGGSDRQWSAIMLVVIFALCIVLIVAGGNINDRLNKAALMKYETGMEMTAHEKSRVKDILSDQYKKSLFETEDKDAD